MSGNTELLNFVYQNSQMGMESLSQLLEIAEDEEFRSCMEKQLDKYREFHNEAKRLLQERGHNEKSLGMFDKLKTYLMINMQTMSDKSTSHLAQMLIEGSSMGVTNALAREVDISCFFLSAACSMACIFSSITPMASGS